MARLPGVLEAPHGQLLLADEAGDEAKDKAVEASDQVMQAPLLRGATAPVGSEAASQREAVRSGNNLTIRKP